MSNPTSEDAPIIVCLEVGSVRAADEELQFLEARAEILFERGEDHISMAEACTMRKQLALAQAKPTLAKCRQVFAAQGIRFEDVPDDDLSDMMSA